MDQGLREARELAGVDLFEARQPALRVQEARRTVVVISRSREPRREVLLDRCVADGVPVVVRPSGGGAVVLAPGVVTASLLAPWRGPTTSPEVCFRRHCTQVALALADCGLHGAVMRGVSDLCIGQRKVAGSSLRLMAGLVLYQVAVLVEIDPGLLERYLPQPSREPAYRAGRSHRDFVTCLREQGLTDPTHNVVEAMERRLAEALAPACA